MLWTGDRFITDVFMPEEFKRIKEGKKNCVQCGRYLDAAYPEDICPFCKEANLFSEVKEYIRSHEVKENDVAEHFGIPIRKIREWIREGRIQYKGYDEKKFSPLHCHVCGKPIEFGTMCSDCLHTQQLQVVLQQRGYDNKGEMRFRYHHEKE